MRPYGRAVPLRCPHVFGAAVFVFLDERVRHLDNLPRRAVVLLHVKHLGVGIDLIKFGQRLRIGRAEAVNTLIFIADQKQIAVLPGQQPDDGMLDFRGVLRLVDAEIAVLRLYGAQYLGVLPQDAQRIDHLVVVIHLLPRAQRFVVSREKGRKINSFDLDLSQCVALQHLVFGIGQRSLQGFDRAFGGKFAALGAVQLSDERGFLTAVFQQPERRAPEHALVPADDAAAHAVDRAEGELSGFLRAEQRSVPCLHIARRRDRIGHGQNAFRRDAAHMAHITQPRDQCGGFAAARHGKQQHRPVDCLYRHLLLRVQLQTKTRHKL